MKHVYPAAVLVLLAASAALAGQSSAQEHPQLSRGKEVYAQFCTQCHGVDGKRGEGYQTPIWGEGSIIAAKFENAQNLIEYMQIMPFNDPRLIDDAQRLDVTAFVLANHGALAKSAELSTSNAAGIRIK
jgi:mono/diheme cytochrome c family protein